MIFVYTQIVPKRWSLHLAAASLRAPHSLRQEPPNSLLARRKSKELDTDDTVCVLHHHPLLCRSTTTSGTRAHPPRPRRGPLSHRLRLSSLTQISHAVQIGKRGGGHLTQQCRRTCLFRPVPLLSCKSAHLMISVTQQSNNNTSHAPGGARVAPRHHPTGK